MRERLRDHGIWFLAAVMLLAGLTLYTRGAAPGQKVLTNDEMMHLESWRNRYRTDDIFPSFLVRAQTHSKLAGTKTLEFVETAYEKSTLFQRGLLILVDVHPPVFPVLAELLEAVTHSSLLAVRMVSAIAGGLAVLFAYRLGRALRDPALGLWLGALVAISFLAQLHSGIARPAALTHFSLILALYAFVRDETEPDRPPWRFLLAALFAQSTDWLVWAIVFPPVLLVLLGRVRRRGLRAVAGQAWWYAAGSVAMLPFLAVHFAAGYAGTHLAQRPLSGAWYCQTLGSPFASLDHVLAVPAGALLSPAMILLIFLVIGGAVALFADAAFWAGPGRGLGRPGVSAALTAALVVSALLAVFAARGHVEMALIFAVLPSIFAGIGLRWLCRTERASEIAVVATLAVFTVIRIGWPEDPLKRAMLDTDYAAVAQRIRAERGPDDAWTAFGAHRADCLYRYGPLPDPIICTTRRDFQELLDTLPHPGSSVFVFARGNVILAYRELRTAPEHWEFPNGYFVVRIPPSGRRR